MKKVAAGSIIDYIKDGWVKILRTGTWTDRRKREHHFDENRLQRIADNYTTPLDFSIAPITATHDAKPTTPKLGKIESLKRIGEFLLAKPVNVAKDMVTMLKDIGYKFVSTSLNPNDTLNHLAIVPNPAVAGLGEFNEAALNFSQGEDTIELCIEFSALEEEESEKPKEKDQLKMWISAFLNEKVVKPIARQYNFSTPPELIIDDEPTNQKNEEIDEKEEQHMFQRKKKPDEEKPQAQDTAAVESPGEKDENENIDFAAELATATAKADAATKKANELQARLEQMELQSQEKEVADFCDSLKPGAVLPKFMPGVKRLLNLLAGEEETFDFSTDGKGEKETCYEFAKAFLSSLESQIPLDPLKKTKGDTGEDDEIEFADADDEELELHRKVKAVMKEKGIGYEQALDIVEKRR